MKLLHDLTKTLKSDTRERTTLILIALIAISVVCLAVWFSHKRAVEDNRSDIERITESPSGYSTIDGQPFTFDTSTHRYTIVTSWATWCSLCQAHLTALGMYSKEAGSDIVVIAVNRKEQKNIIDSYVREISLPSGITYVLDNEDFFLKITGGYAVPETIVYDSSGNERNRIRVPLTLETSRLLLQGL